MSYSNRVAQGPERLWVRLLPILIFEIYLSATVLLFAFGPWPYPVQNPYVLYGYVASGQLLLLLGYLSAVKVAPTVPWNRIKVDHLVMTSAIANVALLVPTLLLRTGGTIQSVTSGLSDPGSAYMQYQQLRTGANPVGEYIRMLFGPLLALSIPLGAFYWTRISLPAKVSVVLSVLSTVTLAIAQGVNRDLIFPLAIIVWMLIAGHLSGRQRFSRAAMIGGAIAVTCALGAFLIYFTLGMQGRPTTTLGGYDSNVGIAANMENPLVKGLPAETQFGVLTLSGYLASGYYALGLALEKPFEPTYGYGHSMFLTRQAERFVADSESVDRSYPERILRENGYNIYGLYTTAYPWIASDVTFVGALAVMFLFGRVLCLSWTDCLVGSNPFSVAVLAQFVILLSAFVTYLWNTNTGEGLTGFWGAVLAWVFTRRHYVLARSA